MLFPLTFAFLLLQIISPPAKAEHPNFLVILGEAQGWSSASIAMDEAVPESKSPLARTPNLAALAAAGTRFANFYAASPRCMPTRAALFTGKSPAALHMTFIGENKREEIPEPNWRVSPPKCLLEMPETETTIAELLKQQGYATAHFGKWHAGRASPSRHGFDESDGPTSNVGPNNDPNPNPKECFEIARRGGEFMARQVQAGKPFYLQISHYAGTGITSARPETYAAIRQRSKPGDEKLIESAAMSEDMDASLGTLLSKLESLGISSKTFVIYTADHGSKGHNTNFPLANGKGTVWEGGIRVPLIIRGPTVKGGFCSHTLASTVDLFPTIASFAGIHDALPKALEGGNLAPLLAGNPTASVKRLREEFVVHFPHYDKDEQGPASSIILGTEKLIRTYHNGALHLFDLASDRGERRDLAKERPERAAELDRRLTEYLQVVHAQLPTPNPNFDPSAPAPVPKKGPNKKEKGEPK